MLTSSVLAASSATTPLGIAYWASPIAILLGAALCFGRTSSARVQLFVGAGLGAALAFTALAVWFHIQTGNFAESMSPLKVWLATVMGGLLGIACAIGIRIKLDRQAS